MAVIARQCLVMLTYIKKTDIRQLIMPFVYTEGGRFFLYNMHSVLDGDQRPRRATPSETGPKDLKRRGLMIRSTWTCTSARNNRRGGRSSAMSGTGCSRQNGWFYQILWPQHAFVPNYSEHHTAVPLLKTVTYTRPCSFSRRVGKCSSPSRLRMRRVQSGRRRKIRPLVGPWQLR